MPTDDELYQRGVETLVASWRVYAGCAVGASVQRYPGVTTALFPREPERGVYNNAVLRRGLDPQARADALERMESVYATAGIGRFAAWVHEADSAAQCDLDQRGYTLDTTTRAMGMSLEDIRRPEPESALDLRPLQWSDYLRLFDLPEGLLGNGNREGLLRFADYGALPDRGHRGSTPHPVGVGLGRFEQSARTQQPISQASLNVVVAFVDGDPVTSALTFDCAGDCGIYNVGTLPHVRRRGLATALTAELLRAARARGCETATLQATPMAERVYAAVGFRDLGRFLEYVPSDAHAHAHAKRCTSPDVSVQPCVSSSS